MEKMQVSSNNYNITNQSHFERLDDFGLAVLERVFDFSWNMTFGANGAHRSYRSGGQERRVNGKIFIQTFQGKLAEFATKNIFEQKGYTVSDIDLSVHALGLWDAGDLVINNSKVSVKSTKYFGNLLLLETKDWSNDGEYIPNNNYKPDKIILIRIKPDGESLMKQNKMLYSDMVERDKLSELILKQKWEFDSPGFIDRNMLLDIINNSFIIPQGGMLNGRTIMDAENYYCQSGCMIPISRIKPYSN